jgi:hypothetical protein
MVQLKPRGANSPKFTVKKLSQSTAVIPEIKNEYHLPSLSPQKEGRRPLKFPPKPSSLKKTQLEAEHSATPNRFIPLEISNFRSQVSGPRDPPMFRRSFMLDINRRFARWVFLAAHGSEAAVEEFYTEIEAK